MDDLNSDRSVIVRACACYNSHGYDFNQDGSVTEKYEIVRCRDHHDKPSIYGICTPEERAMTDAVLRYRNHMREKYHYIAVEYLFSSMDDEDGVLCTAVIEAADKLLAARAGKETG